MSMCAALTLPDDLTHAERAVLDEHRDAAADEAQRRVALAFNVRREVERLVLGGLTVAVAITQVGDDPDYPASPGTVHDIWYRRRSWAL